MDNAPLNLFFFFTAEQACMWGRNVNDSIRKFLQFQMTINITAIVLAFVGSLTYGESPLKVQNKDLITFTHHFFPTNIKFHSLFNSCG